MVWMSIVGGNGCNGRSCMVMGGVGMVGDDQGVMDDDGSEG